MKRRELVAQRLHRTLDLGAPLGVRPAFAQVALVVRERARVVEQLLVALGDVEQRSVLQRVPGDERVGAIVLGQCGAEVTAREQLLATLYARPRLLDRVAGGRACALGGGADMERQREERQAPCPPHARPINGTHRLHRSRSRRRWLDRR